MSRQIQRTGVVTIFMSRHFHFAKMQLRIALTLFHLAILLLLIYSHSSGESKLIRMKQTISVKIVDLEIETANGLKGLLKWFIEEMSNSQGDYKFEILENSSVAFHFFVDYARNEEYLKSHRFSRIQEDSNIKNVIPVALTTTQKEQDQYVSIPKYKDKVTRVKYNYEPESYKTPRNSKIIRELVNEVVNKYI